MIIFFHVFLILFFFSLYLFLLSMGKAPDIKVLRLLKKERTKERQKHFTSFIEAKIYRLSEKIPYKDAHVSFVQHFLISCEKEIDPRLFMTIFWLLALVSLVLSILLAFLSKGIFLLLSLTLPVLVLLLYLSPFFRAKQKRKESLDMDIPRLICHVANMAETTKDIPVILASYLPLAENSMKAELTKCLCDFQTRGGDYAIAEWGNRIRHPLHASLVEGLLSFYHGEDMKDYFHTLMSRVDDIDKERRTMAYMKISKRTHRLSMLLLMSLFFHYIAILVSVFSSSIGGLFL